MKKLILFLLLSFTSVVMAGPVEVVDDVFKKLSALVKLGDDTQQINTMCSLVDQYVAMDQVGQAVLGSFAKSGESKSLQDFKELVPSIIVTDMQKITDYLTRGYTVEPNALPRGSNAKGVRVNIEISKPNNNYLKLVVVTSLLGSQWLISDVEFTSFATKMVDAKRKAFAKIMKEDPTHPIGHLVDVLRKDRDLIHCR